MSDEPLKHWAAIITAAAKDHLGLIALALLVICFLTYRAMGIHKERKKPLWIYLAGLTSTLLIALLALTYSRPEPIKQAAPVQLAPPPAPAPDIVVNGSQSTTGDQSPAIGSMSGGAINYTSAPKEQR
ncbi:hypothetical protein [Massilia sp. DD77]|uniref:hypothetical protein n=1 Tax=Massilia sp. DD77 TaxID=3109349 RepID=UPI002FFFEC82